MHRRLALAWLLTALLAAAPAHAVLVHGLEHSPRGSALLSVSGAGETRTLTFGNLGGSGLDGANVPLLGANGYFVREIPNPHRGAITRRDLGLRVEGAVPSPAVVLSEISTGGACEIDLTTPGASGDVTTHMWNGRLLVYGGKKGYDYFKTHRPSRTNFAILLGTDSTRRAVSLRSRYVNGLAVNEAVVCLTFSTPQPIAFDGINVTADQIEFSLPVSVQTTRCFDAVLRFTGSGGQAEIAIDEGGQTRPRPKGKRMLAFSGLGGAQFEVGGGSASTARIRVIGPDMEPDLSTISLNGLPPGEPILRGLAQVDVPMDPATLSMPIGKSLVFTARIVAEGASGSPLPEHSLTMTRTGASTYVYGAGSTQAGVATTYELWRGPRQTVLLDGSSSLSAPTPHVHRVAAHRSGGGTRIGFAAPGGVTHNGILHDCDSVVVRFEPAAPGPISAIADIRIRAAGVGVTLLEDCSAMEAGEVGSWGSTPVRADGAVRLAPLPDGSLQVLDFGADPADGLTWETGSLRSLRVAFPSGLTAPPDRGVQLSVKPCDDGSCAPNLILSMAPTAAGDVTRFLLERPPGTTSPVFLGVDGSLEPADLVGGLPAFDIQTLDGSLVTVRAMRYRMVADDHVRMELHFDGAVQRVSSGQPRIIENKKGLLVDFRLGVPGSPPIPPPAIVSLNGLPPGEPWLGRPSFSIGEPGVQVAGDDVGELGLDTIIDGTPVRPAWASLSPYQGPGGDLDGDGDWDCAQYNPREVTLIRLNSATDSADVVIRDADEDCDGTADRGIGFLLEADIDSTLVGDSTSILIAVDGTEASIPIDRAPVLRISRGGGGAGGMLAMRPDFSAFGGEIEALVYAGGALVARQTPTEPILSGALRRIRVIGPDMEPDVDWIAIVDFDSAHTITLDGVVYACDRLELRSRGTNPVDDVCALRVGLNGLPPGMPLVVRSASIDNMPPTVSAGHAMPAGLMLAMAGANPAHGRASLRLSLPAPAHVRVSVHDVLGREVAVLARGRHAAGSHTLVWDGQVSGGRAAAGIYFVHLRTGDGRARSLPLTLLP